MKRHGGLFEQCVSVQALYQGYLDARRHKRSTRACLMFERRLGAQIHRLHDALVAGTYRPSPYATFQVLHPKPRTISAPSFADRIVQHAVYNVVRPIFDRSFIDQSFACRHGRGTHMAADYAQRALQRVPRDSYSLQLDVRRFYYSIDRAILRVLVERRIKDRRVVDLMMLFADHGSPLGVPIGNLLSQLSALIYLNPLDHFIKRELKVRWYCRYVDDFILFGLTRDQALAHRAAISDFLQGSLRLELSRSSILPARRGVNFVGYRTWASRRFVRRRALYNFRHAAKRGDQAALVSMLGHAKRTASHAHAVRHLHQHHRQLYAHLPPSHWRRA